MSAFFTDKITAHGAALCNNCCRSVQIGMTKKHTFAYYKMCLTKSSSPITSLDMPLGLQEFKAARIFRHWTHDGG